jgi:nitrogen fixation protein NifQ
MTASEIYQMLIGPVPPGDDDRGFDRHTLACIIAIGMGESVESTGTAAAAVGLSGDEIAELGAHMLPATAVPLLQRLRGQCSGALRDDEACLRQLLGSGTTESSRFEIALAAMISRRSQRPHHLWQDLGLRNRGELSRMLLRHFRPLAARNIHDMKWKRFFYRAICRDDGFLLCSAPVCAECCDFEHCFGTESGESLLAHLRNAPDIAA